MIFQEKHREQIRTGEKTVTRRQWDDSRVTVGKTYRATLGGNVEQGMFTPRSDCDCFIRVTEIYHQRLGDMTDEDARREGDYESKEEFVAAWRDINEGWDSDETVWVVEFEYAGDSDPKLEFGTDESGEGGR